MANDVSLPRISSATGEIKIDRGRDARRHTSINAVIRAFPFRGYMEPMRDAYEAISASCLRLLPPGSRILDFGAGTCEKTAVLSMLGHPCTAVDDFNDDWHQIAGNREKMLAFVKAHNVELIVNEGVHPAFQSPHLRW